MEKRIIFILCLFLTLGVSKVMATTDASSNKANSTILSHGNMTELSEVSMDIMFLNSSELQNANCSATILIKYGNGIEVKIEISGECQAVIKTVREIAKLLTEESETKEVAE